MFTLLLSLFLCSPALGQEVTAVNAGEVARVEGPAVHMPEHTFTEFLKAKQREERVRLAYNACVEDLVSSQERAARAFEVARKQFAADERAVAELTAQATQLAVKVEQFDDKLRRARNQRNVAVGVTGGLVLGAVTAITVAAAK